MTDHYAVLGVAGTASPAEITRAYRRLVRRYHPDAQQAGSQSDQLREVVAAYAVLRDPVRRANYDRRHWPRRTAHSPDDQPLIRVGPVRYHGPAAGSPSWTHHVFPPY